MSNLFGSIYSWIRGVVFSISPATIVADTADGADNKYLALGGGGAAGSTRGAFLELHGNEEASTGIATLSCGNVAGGQVSIRSTGTQAINLTTNNLLRWTVNGTTGDVESDATNGGHIRIQTAGKGLMVKEGANARMGTLTLNGATEVTVNTTAVAATSRIFLSIQAPGGTPSGTCYVSSRVAGTSFGVKSIALDTSTVAWLIIDPA